jgi:hypothetical protein
MQMFVALGSMLVVCIGAVGPADDVVVKDRSAQYAAMVLKGDKDGLKSLLHDEYQGWLPSCHAGDLGPAI